jgi:L-ribulokinase
MARKHSNKWSLRPKVYKPDPKAIEVYKELYLLFKELHDACRIPGWNSNLFDAMKKFIEVRIWASQ